MNKSGFSIVKTGPHKVGLLNEGNQFILPCEYDEVMDFDDDGYVRFLKDGIYGTVDLQGKICIDHALQLTHLGVFYQGVARARKNGAWGLVDVHGKAVIPFEYKYIRAHYGEGYVACKMDGTKGNLSELGVFTAKTEPEAKPKPAVKPQPAIKPLITPKPEVITEWVPDEEEVARRLKDWAERMEEDYHFYYLDTDAPIEVKKIYKRGQIFRAGRYIDISTNLRRPITKTRFLIQSNHLFSMQRVERFAPELLEDFVYRQSVITPFSFFLVEDVYEMMGITQVLLVHVPAYLVDFATKYRLNLSKIHINNIDGWELKKAAKMDLNRCLGDDIHGYSLSAYWQQMMAQPIGLDADNVPYDVKDWKQCFSSEKEFLFYDLLTESIDRPLLDSQEKEMLYRREIRKYKGNNY